MRVAIYGAGGMGTVLGAYITKAGYEIDLINRNSDHVKALNSNGATIIGKTRFTQSVKAMLPNEISGFYDIVLLMTKQKYNKEIVTSLLPHLKPTSLLCTMQNGLPEPLIAEIIGENRTCGCTMSWGATFHGGGVSELTSKANRDTLTFSIGKYGDNSQENFDYLVSMLNSMGNVKIEENFIGARWAKLLINSAFSGLSVVTGETFGFLSKHKLAKVLAIAIIKEGIDVAKAANITIEKLQSKNIGKLLDYKSKIKFGFIKLILPIAMKKHALIKSSMLRDISQSRPTEIDYINGVVKNFGLKYNCETPFNNRVIMLVKDIENGKLSPDIENIYKLQDLI